MKKNVVIIILSIIAVALGTFIVYDQFVAKKELKKEPKKVETTKYEYDLSDVSCEEETITDTCTKIQKVTYDGKEHEVKLIKKGKKEEDYGLRYSNELYVDGKYIDSYNGGVSEEKEFFYGGDKILIFDNKYLGVLASYYTTVGESGYYLNVINNNNTVAKDVVVLEPGTAISCLDADERKSCKDKDLHNKYTFDGNKFTMWTLLCDTYKEHAKKDTDGGYRITTVEGAKVAISFDGTKLQYDLLNTLDNVEMSGGGLSTCYSKSSNTIEQTPNLFEE